MVAADAWTVPTRTEADHALLPGRSEVGENGDVWECSWWDGEAKMACSVRRGLRM